VAGQAQEPFTATVTIRADRPIATFRPDRVWGAALDGQEDSEVAEVYTPHNIAAMNSAGLGPVTYRLRTELAIEAWHWNPAGRWSDSAHHQGYWTSDDHSASPIATSYGYRLPRRGNTVDNGNNDGYSRVDDGDTTTCWKSNPYLDPRYTGVSEALHPQWVVVDLGSAQPVNAVHLWWGNPYPLRYRLDYWTGDQSQRIDWNPDGLWRAWPEGAYRDGIGGEVLRRLSPKPLTTRFVRITLLESSHTAVGGSGDPRDSLGFVLREIGIGTIDRSGRFHDLVRRGTTRSSQSAVLVSSTDPWHRESDRDPDVEQPGLDLVFSSGITRGLPALLPVGVLFDTPENAASLLRYVRRRGYPVERLELGEEPDGQRTTPEDYAALYLQAAHALRAVDSTITVGGPSWQSARNDTIVAWPARASGAGRSSWIGRFLDYLEARGASGEFGFFSFEWYPFDDACTDTGPQLAQAPAIMAAALEELRAAGLADSIPRLMTEYGYSAFAGPSDVEISSALLNTEALAGFFTHGGSEAYVYGIEPGSLLREPHCARWGNNLLFLGDDDRQAKYRMPAYHAAWLLTHAWADSSGGEHQLFTAEVRPTGRSSDASLVSAYPLHRPDGRWALLLVNRDPHNARVVQALIGGRTAPPRPLGGPFDLWQYSSAQYQWKDDGANGHPVRDDPPAHRVLPEVTGGVTLPPYSVTVLAGR